MWDNTPSGVNACAYYIDNVFMPIFDKMSIDELNMVLAYYKNPLIVNDPFQYNLYIKLLNKYGNDSGFLLIDILN